MKVGVFHWAFDFIGGGEKVATHINTLKAIL